MPGGTWPQAISEAIVFCNRKTDIHNKDDCLNFLIESTNISMEIGIVLFSVR